MNDHLAQVTQLRSKKAAENGSSYRKKEIEMLKKRVEETESLNNRLSRMIYKNDFE